MRDSPSTDEEPLAASNRVLPQLLVLMALLAAVFGVIGGVVWFGGTAISRVLPPSPKPMTIQELEGYTGYDFPEGSEIVSAHAGPRALDRAGSWALLAEVSLPAGSALPVSEDPESTISVLSTDAEGRVSVSVHTDNDDTVR